MKARQVKPAEISNRRDVAVDAPYGKLCDRFEQGPGAGVAPSRGSRLQHVRYMGQGHLHDGTDDVALSVPQCVCRCRERLRNVLRYVLLQRKLLQKLVQAVLPAFDVLAGEGGWEGKQAVVTSKQLHCRCKEVNLVTGHHGLEVGDNVTKTKAGCLPAMVQLNLSGRDAAKSSAYFILFASMQCTKTDEKDCVYRISTVLMFV